MFTPHIRNFALWKDVFWAHPSKRQKNGIFQFSWSNFSDINFQGHKTEAGGTYAGTTDLTKDINKSVISSRDVFWVDEPWGFFFFGIHRCIFFGVTSEKIGFWSIFVLADFFGLQTKRSDGKLKADRLQQLELLLGDVFCVWSVFFGVETQ